MENTDVFEDNYDEYETFTITDKNGNDVELAIVAEFEVNGNNYIAGALIEGDTINEDGVYLYRAISKDGNFAVEKIEDEEEYKEVSSKYMEI